MKSRLTAAEFVEWMGFSLLEPFGDARADDRARGVMAMVLAAGGAKNIDPGKFLATWEPPQEANAESELAAFISRMDALADQSGEPPIS